MTVDIIAKNAPEAYEEAYWKMSVNGQPEMSRNGSVLTIQEPTVLTIQNPLQRVIFDPVRNANPFFHLMETVWMLAGDNHVGFPAKFNSTYVNYAEADGSVHGAYGKRWRDHFPVNESMGRFKMDQIQLAIAMLKKNSEDRRVVLSMWDTPEDLGATKRDLPCNTHIYFRAFPDMTLDMTVCNRSNDLLWGMLGANVVHMTYLQELIALGAGLKVGKYQVVTNNCHVYTDRPDVKTFLAGPPGDYDYYRHVDINTFPILWDGETSDQLLEDCEVFVRNPADDVKYNTIWMTEVVVPMYVVWVSRRLGLNYDLDKIKATDWRRACQQWIERKTQSSATLTGQLP